MSTYGHRSFRRVGRGIICTLVPILSRSFLNNLGSSKVVEWVGGGGMLDNDRRLRWACKGFGLEFNLVVFLRSMSIDGGNVHNFRTLTSLVICDGA
jgi:hypothetical protein